MFAKRRTTSVIINGIDRDRCATKPGREMTRRSRVAFIKAAMPRTRLAVGYNMQIAVDANMSCS